MLSTGLMRFLRGLSGRLLPCGCLAGVYEMYDGDIVTIIDARGSACQEAGHSLHAVIAAVSADAGRRPSRSDRVASI